MMPQAVVDCALGGKRVPSSRAVRLNEDRSSIFHRNNVTDVRPAIEKDRCEVSWPGITRGFHPKGDRSSRRVKFRISRDGDLGERHVETHQAAAPGIGGNPGGG